MDYGQKNAGEQDHSSGVKGAVLPWMTQSRPKKAVAKRHVAHAILMMQ